jgi:15-cis-phytoene synthase
MILDKGEAEKHAALAGHAGCAQAITGLLRLLPTHRARGQCYIPADILAAAGTSREEFLAGEKSARPAVVAIMALAREHLEAFVNGAKELPRSLRPAFLPLALVPAYLDRMGRIDPLTEVAELSALRKQWLTFRRAVGRW